MTPITPQDVNKYITTIRVNFENSYKTQNDEEREILIKSWFTILKDYPKEIVDKAVINAIKYTKSKDFAPRIGDIIERIEIMREAYEKSAEELWAELTGVLRKVSSNTYAYHFTYREANGKTQGENALQRNKDIFEGLSSELKAYCQNLGGLTVIAEYSAEQLTYEKGRFLRTMPTIKERARTRQETPNLAGLIKGLSGALDCDGMKLLKGD